MFMTRRTVFYEYDMTVQRCFPYLNWYIFELGVGMNYHNWFLKASTIVLNHHNNVYL